MLQEAIAGLAIKSDGIYVDGTLGRGGHASAILQALGTNGRLLVVDKDRQAFAEIPAQLKEDARVLKHQGSFADLKQISESLGLLGQINGILLDLGVSSPQLDDANRGFSFTQSGPLDMRMDTTKGLSAADWLAVVEEEELANVLFELGEERFSRRIAKAICNARTLTPITDTLQLAEIVKKANPAWEKHKHPATRAFQAIRIKINDELSDLQIALKDSREILAVGGRLAIISFHSLEDRLVKRCFQQKDEVKVWPKGLPIREEKTVLHWKQIGKAIKPQEQEVKENTRSRSAVLRIAEKIT